MRKIVYAIVLVFIILTGGHTQDDDYTWWNNKHNWDGVTHWSRYMTYSPAYFGPNALPVPEIRDGLINKRISLESRADAHLSTGDNTYNLFLKLDYPFWDGRIAVEVFGVPVEAFKMDTITRDERASRDIDAQGVTVGDLYFSTKIQLLRDHRTWPDIMLGVTLRTASGGQLGNARYTDAPGYYFDVSAGKSFSISQECFIRPYLMLGFYAWQTNDDQHSQNDAFLYGLGLAVFNKKFEFNARYGGYSGYLNNGDAPMVIRANAILKRPKTNYKLSFQQGLQDLEYTSVSLGVILFFNTK